MLFLLLFFFTVDVGEETPRTVCSGLVGSVQLEGLQVQAAISLLVCKQTLDRRHEQAGFGTRGRGYF